MRSRPFVFRVHDEPDPEKLKNFAQVVKAFGYSMNLKSTRSVAESMNKLLRDVQGKPECSMLEMLAIRTMAKAHYTIKNIGHYGLGFEHYTHFTSPIRRYPDVMVHRLLEKHLHEAGGAGKVNEKDLEEQCRQSSHMERNAEEAERESVKYMQVKYMADKVGGEFEGMISGVSEWGIYVEIAENHCEGMVRLKDMKDDFYRYDEKNHCVTGSRYKRKYTLGDRVKIEVKRADLIKKQLDFALAEETEKHAEAHPKKKIYKSRK
jgi:ribonuclease R